MSPVFVPVKRFVILFKRNTLTRLSLTVLIAYRVWLGNRSLSNVGVTSMGTMVRQIWISTCTDFDCIAENCASYRTKCSSEQVRTLMSWAVM